MMIPIRGTLLVLLLLCSVCVAQTAAPLYALVPPGHGENGDWAFLNAYRKDNAALRPDPLRVVFLGDSITAGWTREPFIAGNSHYVGRGIGGQTTQQMLVRFRADVIELKPALVHIMGGTNDVAGNNGPESDQDIEGAIESMVQLARANHIKVLLASIPPAEDFGWHRGLNPAPRIRRLNAWIKSYASRSHVGYVDYWSALATETGALKPELSMDGVHPNSQGFKVMEPFAQAAIDSELGKK
jgi:lysophospholipase L1-like esterase